MILVGAPAGEDACSTFTLTGAPVDSLTISPSWDTSAPFPNPSPSFSDGYIPDSGDDSIKFPNNPLSSGTAVPYGISSVEGPFTSSSNIFATIYAPALPNKSGMP